VAENDKVDLSEWDPRDNALFDGDKEAGRAATAELNAKLELLQEKLWADGGHKLLVVLQATDTGGKDGTIRHVFDGTNPQGVKVVGFKKPTDEELAHDYLWRVHQHTPADGEIVVFNRSHYEDVLVVRVHDLVPKERWKRRYEHIRNFEQLLLDEGTTVVKFFLNISKDEQKERLQARLDDPEKHWKFAIGDLAEREHWDDYQKAFATMLSETSTDDAPWYVIPADRKWYRNLVITQVLVDTLEAMDLDWPEPEDSLDGVVVD
jgi:PPK2 family polyphosphate:nucleotide phosphotransferase